MSVLERDIERVFVREARRRGFLVLKLNVRGQRGWPDRLLVDPVGIVYFVELKRPKGGRLSPSQKRVHAALKRRDVDVVMVKSRRDFRRVWGIS